MQVIFKQSGEENKEQQAIQFKRFIDHQISFEGEGYRRYGDEPIPKYHVIESRYKELFHGSNNSLMSAKNEHIGKDGNAKSYSSTIQ